MASRADEKARRREERLAAQAEAERRAKRVAAMRVGGGILLAVVVLAVGALLLTRSGGSGGDASAASAAELRRTASAAGCTFRQADSQGSDHVETEIDPADYNTNPPTSGPHSPQAAPDGFYQPGNEPGTGNWIHALEHGRVVFQFRPGTGADVIQQLRDVANEEFDGAAGYHTLVLQNTTKMKAAVAAAAWTRVVECRDATPAAMDVLRKFRATYTDKAPEFVP